MKTVLSIAILLVAAGCDDGEGGGRDAGRTGIDSGGFDSGGGGGDDAGCEHRVEICGDHMDQNCDGRDTSCGDTDMDNIEACRPGEAPPACDCDDSNATVYPPFGATPGGFENCDGLDNDCNGRIDESAQCCAGCAGMGTRGDICATNGSCVCTTNAGQALCAVGQTCCSSGCVDTQTDSDNCGSCGTACLPCAGSDTCVSGGCVCPSMGTSCTFTDACMAGTCVPRPAECGG